MSTYERSYVVDVVVTINDDDVIRRVTDNHDDDGVPQPINSRTGWRNVFYNMETEEDVIGMLAYNCAANGVTDARHLDGWADLAPGVATMHVDTVDVF